MAFAGALEYLSEGSVAEYLVKVEGLEANSLDDSIIDENRLGLPHLLNFVRAQLLPALHLFHPLQIICKVGLRVLALFLLGISSLLLLDLDLALGGLRRQLLLLLALER